MVLCSQSNGFCYMAYSIWIFRKSNNSWVQKMGPNIIIWHSVSVKMLLFPNFCIGSVLLILIFYVIYWIALWSVFVSLWLIHWFWLIGFLNLFIVYTDKLSVVEEIKDEYVTILAKFYIYIHSLRTTLLVCSLLWRSRVDQKPLASSEDKWHSIADMLTLPKKRLHIFTMSIAYLFNDTMTATFGLFKQ